MNEAPRAKHDAVVPRQDVDLHVRVYGQGAPLLLLSGGPGGSCEELLSIVAELCDEHELYLLEQRATGRSRVTPLDATTIRLERYVGDVEAVRAHFELDAWSLLGHSAGGAVAMATLAAHPERVARSVLVETAGPDLGFVQEAPARLRHSEAEQAEMARLGRELAAAKAGSAQVIARELFRLWLEGSVYDRNLVAELADAYVHEPTLYQVAGLFMQNLMSDGYDLKPALANATSPCLIVQGREGYMGPSVGEAIAACMPNAELCVLDACGHYPMFEQPEAFYERVRSFLRS